MSARRPRPSVHHCARLRARARSPRVASRRSVGRIVPSLQGKAGSRYFTHASSSPSSHGSVAVVVVVVVRLAVFLSQWPKVNVVFLNLLLNSRGVVATTATAVHHVWNGDRQNKCRTMEDQTEGQTRYIVKLSSSCTSSATF